MGATYVTVTIRDPATLTKCWEGLFLVDTAATDLLAPRNQWLKRLPATRLKLVSLKR